jgi:nucleotide-binding universal stress UspA family protein
MTTLEAGKRIGFANILFATDFSPYSNAALPYAQALARKYRAKVYGTHVLPGDVYVFVSPESWPAFIEAEDEVRQHDIARLDQQLHDVPHEFLNAAGDVWEAVKRQIQDHDIDLLVVGTHGRTGARRVLMGSVAEKIFRSAPCPVLTVGPQVAAPPEAGVAFRHILLATDFGEGAAEAAAHAISIAQENHSTLCVLHIVDDPKAGTVDFRPDSVFEMERLRDLVPLACGLEHGPEYFVEFGTPAEQIVDFAERRGIDLLVMGAHTPHTRLGRVTNFTHSTAQHIVAQAPCPVLTVRG